MRCCSTNKEIKKISRRLKPLVFFLSYLSLLFIFSSPAQAFFVSEDDFESGVFLNKSHITYDLTPLDRLAQKGKVTKLTIQHFNIIDHSNFDMDIIDINNLDGMTGDGFPDDINWIPGAYYIYRSHYNSDLGVVVYEFDDSMIWSELPYLQNAAGEQVNLTVGNNTQFENFKGLSVNLVVPTKLEQKNIEMEIAFLKIDGKIDLFELEDLLFSFMYNLSYDFSSEEEAKLSDGQNVSFYRELMFSKNLVEIHVASGDVRMTWDPYSQAMDKDWDSFGEYEETSIWVLGPANQMQEYVDADVKKLLGFLNFNEAKWDTADRMKTYNNYLVLTPKKPIDLKSFNWTRAMDIELKWLVGQNVIKGVNDEMNANISNSVIVGSQVFIGDELWPFGLDRAFGVEINGYYELYSFSYNLDKHFPKTVVPPTKFNPYSNLITASIIILLIALGTFSYTRLKRRSILDNLNRKNIFEHVKANPGVHFKRLLRELNFKPGALSYHLNVLEKGEFVKSIQDGNHRRFYLYGTKSDFKIMLTSVQLRILSVIDERPGISQSEISRSIGANRMVINYHVRILNDAGIISLEKSGRKIQCYTTSHAGNFLPG